MQDLSAIMSMFSVSLSSSTTINLKNYAPKSNKLVAMKVFMFFVFQWDQYIDK